MTTSDWGIEDLDLDAYLTRIGVPEPTLKSVHAGHVRGIPFENIEVLLGDVPALDVPSLQAKLVQRRRGGYCYEHNLLYAAALERLGIQVSRQLARIMLSGPPTNPRTHMVLLATVDREQYLTDVGFGGGCLLEPMPLREGTMRQGDWTFQLSLRDGMWVLQSLTAGDWRDLYGFRIERQYPADYVVANFYTARSPSSPFVGRLVVQQPGDESRRTLIGDELTVARPDGETEKRTVTPGEVRTVLRDDFGIELTDAETTRLVARFQGSA